MSWAGILTIPGISTVLGGEHKLSLPLAFQSGVCLACERHARREKRSVLVEVILEGTSLEMSLSLPQLTMHMDGITIHK